jgi:hypothetical protein
MLLEPVADGRNGVNARAYGAFHAPGKSCRRLAIIPRMTLLEITFELQSPLSLEQLNRLGEFANTYGLRKFSVDEQKNHLTFEYDASRLRETQIANVLAHAGIAVTRRVN